jgi:hypothetical protein
MEIDINHSNETFMQDSHWYVHTVFNSVVFYKTRCNILLFVNQQVMITKRTYVTDKEDAVLVV